MTHERVNLPYMPRIVQPLMPAGLVRTISILLGLTLLATGCKLSHPPAASTIQPASTITASAIEPSLPSATAPPTAAAAGAPIVEPLMSRQYGALLLKDTEQVLSAPIRWRAKEWALFGVDTAAVVGTALFLDRPMQRAAQRHRNRVTNGIAAAFNPLGNEAALAIPGGFYLAGVVWHNDTAKAVAQDGLAASLVEAGIITPTLKLAFGRSRPKADQGAFHFAPFSGADVFPSGHTGEAFTLASTIAEHYESAWIKRTAYGMAGLVGFARIVSNAHYTSDVVAGALIGTLVGRLVVRFNQRQRLQLSPLVDGKTSGLQGAYTF